MEDTESNKSPRFPQWMLIVLCLLATVTSVVSMTLAIGFSQQLRTLIDLTAALQNTQATQQDQQARTTEELQQTSEEHVRAIMELYSNQEIIAKAAGLAVDESTSSAFTEPQPTIKPQN